MFTDYEVAHAVVEEVERYFRVADIFEKTRRSTVARPRAMAIYLIREMTQLSYPEIGSFFGCDHTTALHRYRMVQRSAGALRYTSILRPKVLAALGQAA